MVHLLRRLRVAMRVYHPLRCERLVVAFVLCQMAICLTMAVPSSAQVVHYRHSSDMPPGAIGTWQLQRGGPLPGYFQPATISVPNDCAVSLATAGAFDEHQEHSRRAAFLIGQVYRLKVTQIPLHEGVEVFPTIEVIDRIYPPAGREFEFPIQIRITRDDLRQAMQGRLVTRVIYVEDPRSALPAVEQPNQQYAFDVRKGDDPLRVADTLGRPVAILRLGARVPGPQGATDRFLFGCPVWMTIPEGYATNQGQTPRTLQDRPSMPSGNAGDSRKVLQ